MDEAAGLLLVQQRVSFDERPVVFVSPDGTVVARTAASASSFRWAGSGQQILGYGTVGDETGPVWIDTAIPSITPVPELAGQRDLLPGTIDRGTGGQPELSGYAVLSDEELASYTVNLETGAVTELAGVIRRSEVFAFGQERLLAYGPEWDFRLVDLVSGSVESLGPPTVGVTVAPDQQSFIYRDVDIRAFRERTADGEDRVITSPSALAALYRPDGDVVVITEEQIVVRTKDGEEVLYTAPDFVPVFVRPTGIVVFEDGEGSALWLPTDGSPLVRLDHPGREAREVAVIDDRWLLVEESDYGLLSLIDLRNGERVQLGDSLPERNLIGAPRMLGPWFWLPMRTNQVEDWLIDRETGRLVVVSTLFGVIPSPDARWLSYGREADAGRVVYVAPIEDPLSAVPVFEGTVTGWLPYPIKN